MVVLYKVKSLIEYCFLFDDPSFADNWQQI